jgi:hypothetical protein
MNLLEMKKRDYKHLTFFCFTRCNNYHVIHILNLCIQLHYILYDYCFVIK